MSNPEMTQAEMQVFVAERLEKIKDTLLENGFDYRFDLSFRRVTEDGDYTDAGGLYDCSDWNWNQSWC